MPGQTFVVVADPALLPAVLGRPGLPKSRVYELGFFVRTSLLHDIFEQSKRAPTVSNMSPGGVKQPL